MTGGKRDSHGTRGARTGRSRRRKTWGWNRGTELEQAQSGEDRKGGGKEASKSREKK